MDVMESVRIALRGLSANKLRSALTMLGIIIGVAAVIALMSVGKGVEATVTGSFQGLGSNLLFVFSGGNSDQPKPLTYSDAEAIADPFLVPDVVAVAPAIVRNAEVVYRDQKTVTSVNGVTPEYEQVRNFYVEEGEFISQEDLDGRMRVAVLGKTVVENLFSEDVYPIGQVIRIRGVPFRVIGIMEEKGGSGFGDEDDVIFVPLTSMDARLFHSRTSSGDIRLSVVYVQVASEEVIDRAIEDISNVLRDRHRIAFREDDDFTIISQADVLSIAQDITGVLTIFLGSIAAISLLVGGIGIMNIMLVSVTERTREIGIRKAVGARRRDILLQFLIESMVLSMLGGVVGIVLGVGGSKVIANMAQNLETVVTPDVILLATGFSAAVGLFFGIYPATRAARLHPIEALRYE